MLQKLLGLSPSLESDGTYTPSKTALKFTTADLTDYENIRYEKYQGWKKKVLVIFTEQKNMTMQNGKLFSTGNHPVEALIPMLHLKNAGFEFEIVTLTGKPVVFEMWAFPERDNYLRAIYQEYKSQFDKPKSLQIKVERLVKTPYIDLNYAAVFIPGGHGSMLGIPEDEAVNKTLNWAHENDLYVITICHGLSSLLATNLGGRDFLYKGYNMAVFPDSVDKIAVKIGYLPGAMVNGVSERLKSLGANIINSKADRSVCLDRRLITGSSPRASNPLGKLAAKTLLENLN